MERQRTGFDDEVIHRQLHTARVELLVQVTAEREQRIDLNVAAQVEMRYGLLGLSKPRGDGFAHAVEGDFLVLSALVHLSNGIGGGTSGHGFGDRCCVFGRCCAVGFHSTRLRILDIRFDNPAPRAAAVDLRQVQPLVGRDPAGEGGGKDALALIAFRCGGGFAVAVALRLIRIRSAAAIARFGRLGIGCFVAFFGLWFLFLSGSLGRTVDVVGAFAFFKKNGDGGVHFYTLAAIADQDFADRAFVYRFKLHRRFVGLDFGQNVTGGDGIAFLDHPFGQRAFFHRGRKGGHENFYGHDPLLTDK